MHAQATLHGGDVGGQLGGRSARRGEHLRDLGESVAGQGVPRDELGAQQPDDDQRGQGQGRAPGCATSWPAG